MQQPIHQQFSSIRDLQVAIQTKAVSIAEVIQSAHAYATAKNTSLNCFIELHPETELSAPSTNGASLAGVPIAHKDVFVTKAGHSTAGSKMLANYKSPFDATVVEKLANQGCVSLGKLNCDEFAMGSSNETSFFGAVHNPWNLNKTAGGSSGGSAAAVAGGLVMVATGTDTGGSIRQPASFCGVSGIKPTYGSTSRFGMIAYASSLDQAGVFARNAQDLADTLDIMIGYDDKDSTMVEQSKQYVQHKLKNDFNHRVEQAKSSDVPLKGLRIGLPSQYLNASIDPDITSSIKTALQLFEQLGAELVPIELPLTEMAIPAYYVIASAEASSNLSRYDSVRFGHRSENFSNFADMVAKSRTEAFGSEVQRRILVGTYVLSHGFYDAYYVQAQKVRRLVAQDFLKSFQQSCDVIIGPVAPTTAWDLGGIYQDPIAMYNADIFTLGPSLAGLPTLSIPCGFSKEKMPIGLQIIGNHFQEAQILALAQIYQLNSEWHLQCPTTY